MEPVRTSRKGGFRRTRWAGLGVVGAVAATMAWGPSASGTPVQAEAIGPGFGSAVAQSFKVNPTIANLSLGIGTGVSLAGHQNSVSQAESRAIDLGIIGTTLAAEGCDGGDPTLPSERQPQALRVDSREEGAADGKTASESSVATKEVRANNQPMAVAITTTAPLGLPGVLEIGPGRSESRSGFITDGSVREAVAISDIAYLKIAGGALTLNGLHWEAIHHSGGAEDTSGAFTVGSATANAGPLSIPIPLDPATVLELANGILNTLGVVITQPVVHEAAGIIFVDPLKIGVVPNATRDAITGQVLSAVQPLRQELFAALLEIDCGNATYITVIDAAVGSITGAGSFALELGGVQATTKAITLSDLLGSGSSSGANEGFGGPASGGSFGGTTGGFGGTTGGTTTGVVAAPAAPPAAPAPAAPISVSRFVGSRGGAMAAVAGAGLLLLAAVAEGDRRKMRRAQREMPVTA